ncbi:PAS domain-containing sensor histidine kinase [Arcobacter roscoffensis]|uniref:histidine kinase n=1 Tax=Arcobacter roscoffensis TaxID=2961520 RepID=A0ABY5E9N7_9BACT|nr:PAS domain-containing sensor histidine kinase [Arcobacter roscoffensis]UTJ07885.1 PAS domain-containing sensor histidine kinase [Arcobacter roscoffensis]
MPIIDNLLFYKQVFDKLQVSIIVINTNTGNITDVNERASKLLKMPCEEIKGMHYSQIHPNSNNLLFDEFLNETIQKLLNEKKVEDFEHFIIDSNKKIIPIEISFNLINIEEKNYLVLMIKDLRLRKQRENLINYYNKALEKSSSFLALVDKNYKYLSVNDYYSKVFGMKKEKFIGKSMSFIFGEEYFNEIIKEKFDKALNGESIEFNTTVDINKKTHYLQVYYEPYYNSEKHIESVVVHVYDMTRFKEYEDDNLKKEKLLIQQSKMASMGEMLENIAHQWRQPLSVISTCTSGIMLQKEFDTLTDEILNESLSNIMNTTNYLSSTIDDFKNFFERDKQKIVFNVSSIINKTLDLVEMSLSSNDIDLIKDLDETIDIENYKNELMQVLLNIVNNAKDALIINKQGYENKKLIKISLYRKDDKTVIEILDNANGVPEEIQEKIFEPYFTTKHQSQGTGIGLFMTREIVAKHMEGEISIENIKFTFEKEEQFGALFRIVI